MVGGRSLAVERTIEVVRGAYQRKVGERLRIIAERFAGVAGLLGVEPEVICKSEHALEKKPRLVEQALVGAAGTRQRLDEPERANVERAFAADETVLGFLGIVAIDETRRGEASL